MRHTVENGEGFRDPNQVLAARHVRQMAGDGLERMLEHDDREIRIQVLSGGMFAHAGGVGVAKVYRVPSLKTLGSAAKQGVIVGHLLDHSQAVGESVDSDAVLFPAKVEELGDPVNREALVDRVREEAVEEQNRLRGWGLSLWVGAIRDHSGRKRRDDGGGLSGRGGASGSRGEERDILRHTVIEDG